MGALPKEMKPPSNTVPVSCRVVGLRSNRSCTVQTEEDVAASALFVFLYHLCPGRMTLEL